MTKLLLMLMIVGLVSGCGGDSPTEQETIDIDLDDLLFDVLADELLTSTTTYDDGTVKVECQYYIDPETEEHIKHGWYKSYHENGTKDTEGEHFYGKKEGKWLRYFDNGNVFVEEHFVDGLHEGKIVAYFRDGNVFSEGNLVGGKREGRWVYYEGERDKEGRPVIADEDIYEDGVCVDMCEGDE